MELRGAGRLLRSDRARRRQGHRTRLSCRRGLRRVAAPNPPTRSRPFLQRPHLRRQASIASTRSMPPQPASASSSGATTPQTRSSARLRSSVAPAAGGPITGLRPASSTAVRQTASSQAKQEAALRERKEREAARASTAKGSSPTGRPSVAPPAARPTRAPFGSSRGAAAAAAPAPSTAASRLRTTASSAATAKAAPAPKVRTMVRLLASRWEACLGGDRPQAPPLCARRLRLTLGARPSSGRRASSQPSFSALPRAPFSVSSPAPTKPLNSAASSSTASLSSTAGGGSGTGGGLKGRFLNAANSSMRKIGGLAGPSLSRLGGGGLMGDHGVKLPQTSSGEAEQIKVCDDCAALGSSAMRADLAERLRRASSESVPCPTRVRRRNLSRI